jgi:hypothetical protein
MRAPQALGRRRRAQARAARQAAAEQRRRARRRRGSQPAPFSLARLRRPGERPGHQASTAHVQAAYPAVTEAGLGSQGVYIGRDAYGGAFVFDPWVLYGQGVITNANTLVFGHVGFGKSALSKAVLWRQRVFGRVVEIIDPKGEYLALVRRMGGVVLRLQPGGSVRLNPLTTVGSREMREGLLEAVTRAMLARPLRQAEALGLFGALAAADVASGARETCVPDVIAQLRAPSERVADDLGMSAREAREELRDCALALRRLCEGPLRGMFDGPTTTGEEVWDAPAVALDLSAIGAGATGSDLALGIMMVCATAFLDAKRTERKRICEASGCSAPKVIRVNDEAWRALPISGLGEYYQAAFKLSRDTGVQHWLVLHRPSDLRAAGDEGSRQQRLAEGLVADASTIVLYHTKPAEIAMTAELFGLSSTEAQTIGGLGRGEALWLVGGRSFLVQHVISEIEWELVLTDAAMLDRPSHPQELPAAEAVTGPHSTTGREGVGEWVA